jgi:hypothetical protein
MKKFFTLCFVVACSTPSFAQITWGTPVTVTSLGTGSNLHPRIALNRSGDPYVLWGKTDTRAYFSKWNGTGFPAPTTVSGALTVFAQSWAGPDLAAYGDTVYVSMKVTPEGVTTNYCYLAHSYDGGTSFSMPVRVDNIDTNISRFATVTANATGNPVVAFMKFNASFGNAQYVVSRSADGGATFSADVLASAGSNEVCNCCPATMLSSGSDIILLYRNNASNIRDSWASISTTGGVSFPGRMNIDNNNWLKTSCPASGPDGFVIGDTLYSVFMTKDTLVSYSRSSVSSMSSASTSRFSAPGAVIGLMSQNYPRVANSGNASTAVWVQNTSIHKYIAYSFTNNITTGGFPAYDSISAAIGSGIMNADVAMSPGAVHIVWEDDNTGKVMYVKGTYLVTTGAEPVAARELIELYPNPAKEEFTVMANNITVSSNYLVDMAGRRTDLMPSIGNGKLNYSVKGIAKGNYYFVMTGNTGKNYYSKLVLQ